MMSLRDLKRIYARRVSKRMAVVLCKRRNTADMRFRPRPEGLTAWSALFVAAFRRAPACLESCASIANQAVSQRHRRIDQRFLKAPHVLLHLIPLKRTLKSSSVWRMFPARQVFLTLKILTCLSFMMSFVSTPALAGTVYVYEMTNGSRLITDVQRTGQEYRLIKEYNTTPYRNAPAASELWTARPIESRYDSLIDEIAATYRLEPALVKAVVHVESAFDPYAISRAGAMGLMQLMPETAARYQLSRNQFDPRRNITAGVSHLRDLVAQFNGNVQFALAGYNAGVGAVEKHRGIPPYAETETYVDRVMKLYSIYKLE